MLIEGIVPFKKTPINIVKTAGRYSPIGIADAVQKGIRAVSKGTYSASEVIDSLASGLTGTGIMALGAYLGSQGLVRGAGTGDEKQDSFDKMRGAQDYSMQIGDKSYRLFFRFWSAWSYSNLCRMVALIPRISSTRLRVWRIR